jgi:hypothetical protein
VCAAPKLAHAGAGGATLPGPSCGNNPDGTGGCLGTFAAFFGSSDPSAYAEFDNVNTELRFRAQLNGKYYECIFPSNSPYAPLFSAALNARSYFAVGWDKTKSCTMLYLVNSSRTSQ